MRARRTSGLNKYMNASSTRLGINAIEKQVADGADRSEAFLHIGKTGGTGIRSFLAAMRDEKKPHPLYLPHAWSYDRIQSLKNITLHMIIRDPLERTVSGFNSRLRQGRPQYSGKWSTAEAIAYTWFESAEALLQAVLSEREIDRSRVNFAFGAVNHLKRGYAFHFGGQLKVKKMQSQIGIIEPLEKTNRFLERLSARYNIDPEFIQSHYELKHVGACSSAKVLEQFSKSELKTLRNYLSREYNVYNWLKIQSKAQAEAPAGA